MKILSCNIRHYSPNDGKNHWNYRKEMCMGIIHSRFPSVISFQEMWREQLLDFQASFPEFEPAVIVDEPVGKNPVNTIFYRRDLFKKISGGGYWLSETPHITGSRSWDSDRIRLVNWLRLEELRTQKEFRIINTHLDHIGQTARENQARLIKEDASVYPMEYPQILTGDMNADSANKAIHILKEGGWRDTYEMIHGTGNPGHTLHRFIGPLYDSDKGKIDWIFIRGNVKVIDAEIIKDSRNGLFPSDHYFVSAEIEL